MDTNLTANIQTAPSTYWSVWATAIWGILIAAVTLILQLTTVVVGVLINNPTSTMSKAEVQQLVHAAASNGTYLSVATLVTAIFGLPLIVGIVRLKRGARVSDYLGLKPFSVLSIIKWLFFLAVLIVLSELLTRALGRPTTTQFETNLFATGKPLWLVALALVVGAPLFEELFFRGFLFKGFEKSFMKPVGAIVVTSALFASIHAQYDLYGMLTIFVMALVLGAARFSTGSIFVPMILHGTSNGLVVLYATVLAG